MAVSVGGIAGGVVILTGLRAGPHGRAASITHLDERTDWDLIQEARLLRSRVGGGSSEPFAALFSRHASRLYSFLSHLTGDPALAEDLTQETFLAAYRNLDRLRPERVTGGRTATLAPWLFRVARNLASSHFRRPSSRETPEADIAHCTPGHGEATGQAFGGDPQESVLDAETRDEVCRQVAALPDRYREPLLLHYSAGLTQAEVAATLSIPLGTVATRLRRAIGLLSRALAVSEGRAGL